MQTRGSHCDWISPNTFPKDSEVMALSGRTANGNNSGTLPMCSRYWNGDGKGDHWPWNGSEQTWDSRSQRIMYSAALFQFKRASNETELMPHGTRGCALKSTMFPRLTGLPDSQVKVALSTASLTHRIQIRFSDPSARQNCYFELNLQSNNYGSA